jgi:hypothetical protein
MSGLAPIAGAVIFAWAALASGAPPESGFPFADETLRYAVNWPSGLSLGEAHMRATHASGRWEFQLGLDAAVPGFAVLDRYRSAASGELCSLEFEKDVAHGRRKTREKTVFDYQKRIARRATAGGGKSESPIAECARDALGFLYYTRREMGQGRMPSPQTAWFGAAYQVRLEYSGAQAVSVNEKRMQADRVVVYIKGPASEASFEIFFARDAARTPLVIRAPLALGVFSMELVR